ncbi:ATP-binding protein [Kitasatospora arboriphila]
MRARTRPAGAAYQGSDGALAVRAGAGMVLGAAAAAAAVALTPSVHRAAVAGVAAVAALLWCGLVGWTAKLGLRARAAEHELAAARRELAETGAAAGALHTDLTAAHTAAGALRAALANAQAETAEIRTDLEQARADRHAARAELTALHEAHSAAVRERTELAALRDQVLPRVVERLRAGASVDTALAGHDLPVHHALLRTVAEAVGRGERQRAAALAVCATAACRVQALATSMHAELRDMQHRHGEDVLGDLLVLDHSTAQVGRMADSIAVLTGARSGRRWTKPIGVESILRGALGRIGAYQRVRLHNASTAAVAGFAAEGVMHVLAELLDNAANFSAPPSRGARLRRGGALRPRRHRRGRRPRPQRQLAAPRRTGRLRPAAGPQRALRRHPARPRRGRLAGPQARPVDLLPAVRPRRHRRRGADPRTADQPPRARPRPGPGGRAPRRGRRTGPGRTRPRGTAPGPRRPGARPPGRPGHHRRHRGRRHHRAHRRPGHHRQRRRQRGRTDTPPAARALPQRRRGQTLAAAAPAAPAAPAPRTERSAALSAARFGAFRKALQGAESPDAHSKDDAR